MHLAPDPLIVAKGYAHPNVLVSTAWLAERLGDPSLRLLECNEDVLLYSLEHIPGAQRIDWHTDLNDAQQRDYVGRAAFEALLRKFARDYDVSSQYCSACCCCCSRRPGLVQAAFVCA